MKLFEVTLPNGSKRTADAVLELLPDGTPDRENCVKIDKETGEKIEVGSGINLERGRKLVSLNTGCQAFPRIKAIKVITV